MPYASEQQRRFMYSQHPDIAARWDKEGKNYVKSSGRTSKRTTKRSSRSTRRGR